MVAETKDRSRVPGYLKWLLTFALWTIPPLLSTTSFLLHSQGLQPPYPWWRFLVIQFVLWFPWALLTPLVFRLARRFPLAKPRVRRHGAVHLVLGAFCGNVFFLYDFGYVLGTEVLAGRDLTALPLSVVVASWFEIAPVHFAIYAILVGVSSAVSYHQKNREREAHLTRARLQALKAQVHPHFLFNTLHAVSTLMDEDVKAARRMIARLSELLRASLSTSEIQEVSLAEELALVELYLGIEEVRFQDRLRVSYDVEPEVREALVPPLVLQPLIENAVRHGISKRSDAGHVGIAAHRENGRLRIRVTDDGPGLAAGEPSEGIGLVNTRSRLEQIYGGAARFLIRDREPRGCEVIVEVPIRWNRPAP